MEKNTKLKHELDQYALLLTQANDQIMSLQDQLKSANQKFNA